MQKEITHSDGDDAQADYEELYVHISAETFEKVDAAVALIELLVTPVSVSQCTIFFFLLTHFHLKSYIASFLFYVREVRYLFQHHHLQFLEIM